MDTLESKLDRLSPEQRKETEDFVDFLLLQSGKESTFPETSSDSPLRAVPPPFIMVEPVRRKKSRLPQQHDKDSTDDCISLPADNEDGPALFHEIDGGIQDRISHDYMDYGQFESLTSPAMEAVKKVKQKIIAKDGQEKSHQLLDWVD